MSDDILKLSATELSCAVRERRLGALEVLKAYIKRAEKNKYNSFITICSEEAEMTASRIDCMSKSELVNLPLAGIPISIKDNICTKGIKTTCASRMLENFIPSYSASVYEKILAAGAVPIGKTNMDEFAIGADGTTSAFGMTLNPHDTERSPGGSSSGSAASVAAGEALLSLGSDTGGSARLPAAFCGVSALKPTYGSVSRFGLTGLAPSLEQICPISRDIRDCALLYSVICGKDERDMTTLYSQGKKYGVSDTETLKGMRIGSIPGLGCDKRLFALLEESGANVSETRLPMIDTIPEIYYAISSAEASSTLARYDGLRYGFSSAMGTVEGTRNEGFGTKVKERLAQGAYVLTYDNGKIYVSALEVQRRLRKNTDYLFEKFDIILTPVSDITAPSLNDTRRIGEDTTGSDKFTAYANLTGIPAVVIPSGDKNKLPVGIQLTAKHGEEEKLCRTAYALERIFKTHQNNIMSTDV
ncbi:MAG: Asp-tRNA(Asn)/Glu-tRNA(Gln) amidotransferase subunit GatA [Clostridiales bacterium]|nr:Asp-tRNA(Asn)/Glu-tRNA(Gln) amidotransferase subunit GatA [Clostridiales bacterium]